MHTNHIDELIGAYLDNQLSPDIRRQVELHLKICPSCTRHLVDIRYLGREMGPLMRTALGQPTLPPGLRHKVKESIYKERGHPFHLFWIVSTRVLNTAGAIAVVLLLTVGLFVLVRTQLPGVEQLSTTVSLSPGAQQPQVVWPTPTASPLPVTQPTAESPVFQSSLGDTLPPSQLPTQPSPSTQVVEPEVVEVTPPFTPKEKVDVIPAPAQEEAQVEPVNLIQIPEGTIAFSLFNSTPGLEFYETHLISPDGDDYRTFPLTGISEPALHPGNNDYSLAVRGWGGPAISRQLISSNLTGNPRQAVSHFWEDAQPDWSPVENRLIFASQRESDRRWRLYTAWGDGSLEVNLRREGKSPTFAPDGQRFAFEACDPTGNRCGLWLSRLGESEKEAKSFLIDANAKAPDWSPVSEEIVYMTHTKDNWDIYVINGNGRNMERLTDDPANDGLPTWSPDGEWIAFVSDRGGQWGVWLLHLASEQLYPVITFEAYQSLTPPASLPLYNEHYERQWWDEQLSWGP